MLNALLPRHDGHKRKAQGYYKANNNIVKYGYWVIVISVLVLWLLKRVYVTYINSRASRSLRTRTPLERELDDDAEPGVTRRQVILTSMRRVFRGYTYPRLAFSSRWLQYFTPPSQGQCLFLGLYWILVLAGFWTNVIFKAPSELYGIQWEVVGFRAAWVSTTQLPLLYATGCRFNFISLMTGVTHERLNWFHRWVARTVFMALIVHWSFFYREWDIAGFVKQEIEIMPMVIWGFAAWGTIGLMVVSGFGWFRDQCFEVWLMLHITLAWAVLGLSYMHTHCTTYFVAASVAMLLFDVVGRVMSTLFCNLSVSNISAWMPRLGHRAKLEILSDEYLRLTIDRPRLRRKAGQHMFVSVPQIRLFQSHPFTIVDGTSDTNQEAKTGISFIIKSHAGFTKALHKLGTSSINCQVRAYLQGPYGNPPVIRDRNIAVFLATGNRASFALSLLMANAQYPGQLSDIAFHWVVPDARMISWYHEELQGCIAACQTQRIHLTVSIHVTRAHSMDQTRLQNMDILAGNDQSSIGHNNVESDRSSDILIEEKVHVDSELETADNHVLNSSSSVNEDDPLELEKQLRGDNETALLRAELNPSIKLSLWPLNANDDNGCDFSIAYGRPSADELVRPSATLDLGKIAVVAAVPRLFAADIACVVSRLNTESNSDIELWLEDNGS